MSEKYTGLKKDFNEAHLFQKKYNKSIDVYGEIDSIYAELKHEGIKPIIQCDVISSENLSWIAACWALEKEDGTLIFESDKYTIDNNNCEINLNKLSIDPTTILIFKARTTGEYNSARVLLEYIPNSNTIAFFELNGNSFHTNLNFVGTFDMLS